MKKTLDEHIAKRLNKCRHFNGVQHRACLAGVVYKDVEGFPCFFGKGRDTCASRERWTEEEARAQEEETQRQIKLFIERMSVVRPAIVKHIGRRKKQFVKDKLECPICKTGTVAYTYAGHYNGHIHAACSTEDCVSWME